MKQCMAGMTMVLRRVPKLASTLVIVVAVCANAGAGEDASTTLEQYGGKAFYKPFFGTIDYTPLGEGSTRLTYTGKGDVFTDEFVGMWVESSRCHKNPNEFPKGVDRSGIYICPGILSARYSKVAKVEDGKNLIVDFEYNGGNVENPQPSTKQDAIFFFNNRNALKKCIEDLERPEVVVGKNGATYAVLKLPDATLTKSIEFRNADGTLDNPCRMKLFMSDAFHLGPDGNIRGTFAGKAFFHETPATVNVHFKWQFLPTIYQVYSVDCAPQIHVFHNKISGHRQKIDTNTSAGEKVFYSYNPFAERDAMKKALGFVRKGANFVMPIYGMCSGGGLVDPETNDIAVYNDYVIHGIWEARTVHNLKCQDRKAGVRFKMIGKSPTERGRMIERIKGVKGTFYPNIRLRWLDNRTIEQDMDDWNWYFVANLYWTGGIKTSAATFGQVNTPQGAIKAGNAADWVLEATGRIGEDGIVDYDKLGTCAKIEGFGTQMSVRTVRFFDRIPAKDDVITLGIFPGSKTLPGKVNDRRFRTWGWAVHKGMVLGHKGDTYTVTRADYCGRNRADVSGNIKGSTEGVRDRDSHGHLMPYHYWEIILDRPIKDDPAEMTVVASKLEYLLDGKFRELEVEFRGNSPLGHLVYMNNQVGMHLENIDYFGNLRSTGEDFDGKHLYSAMDTAVWRNCFAINEDGTPATEARSEWRAKSLVARQRILKDDRYRVIIDGGRTFYQTKSGDTGQVELRNRPTLIFGTHSYGAPAFWNPVVDGKGFVVDAKEVLIILTDDFHLDLSNVTSKSRIILEGSGSVDVTNIDVPYLCIRNDANPGKDTLRITGKGGKAGIRMEGTGYRIGQFSVDLTDWELRPVVGGRGKGFYTVQDTKNPDYAKHIQINGKSMP